MYLVIITCIKALNFSLTTITGALQDYGTPQTKHMSLIQKTVKSCNFEQRKLNNYFYNNLIKLRDSARQFVVARVFVS